MSTFNLNTLRPGDRLVIPKTDLGIIQHHAIFTGSDDEDNRIYIHNNVDFGVQPIYERDLLKHGSVLTRVERFNGNDIQRNEALARAISLIGTKYDLVNFNCEHYANAIQHNKSFSIQVDNGLSLGLIALALYIGFTE